jgi:hypothetical protein
MKGDTQESETLVQNERRHTQDRRKGPRFNIGTEVIQLQGLGKEVRHPENWKKPVKMSQ